MKVLIACEFSGVVREAFRRRGHDAWSCDLLPTEIPGNHIVGDCFDVLRWYPWELLVFHWPCTYMLLSGVRWFTTTPRNPRPGVLYGAARWQAMVRDSLRFKALLECGIPRICGENPTMCGEAQRIIGRHWTQRIQPWQYGHGETKATFLWLVGLPRLQPTHCRNDLIALPEPAGREQRIHKMAPSPTRSKERSRTYPGIAEAMAEQWG